MKINTLLPNSPKELLDEMVHLQEDREHYSGLHDAMMMNICNQLRIHCPSSFGDVWTSSLFPERIAKIACRLAEEYIIAKSNTLTTP